MAILMRDIIFIIAVAMVSSICASGESVNPVRSTRTGRIRGVIREVVDEVKVEVYLSIPFAKPPVGDLRFELPQPAVSWSGVRDAIALPPMCPQYLETADYVQWHRPGYTNASEDCLYLNVFVPKSIEKKPKFAVLVFIHGGSNIAGASMMLDGAILAGLGNIIVVSMAYRLGHLGFLGSTGSELRGNYALHDQLMALRWVQDNIETFGGDKNAVTVLGHSSGGWDAGVLAVSPLATGLFRSVICQSGSVLSNVSSRLSRTLEEIQEITSFVECNMSSFREIKSCLKSRKARDIADISKMRHRMESKWYVEEISAMHPSELLPREPELLLKSGRINGDRFMLGVTDGEADAWKIPTKWSKLLLYIQGSTCIHNLASVSKEVLIHEYTNWDRPNDPDEQKRSKSSALSDPFMVVPSVTLADLLSEAGKTVYVYEFGYTSRRNPKLEPWMRAPHGYDMLYLFGVPLTDNSTYDARDRAVSRFMIRVWTDFVKFGSPVPKRSDINYDTTNHTYLRLSADLGTPRIAPLHHFKTRAKHFWNVYIPFLINNASSSNANVLSMVSYFSIVCSILCITDGFWTKYLFITLIVYWRRVFYWDDDLVHG